MAKRTGLQAFIMGAHYLCGLYAKWYPSMVAFINASDTTSQQKSNAIAALDAVNSACAALELYRVVYER